MKIFSILLVLAPWLWPAAASFPSISTPTSAPAVHAVLFYSPTCPKCVQVTDDYLKTLIEQYGNQLQIIGIDGTTPQGRGLFLAAVERFAIPERRQGFPTLIVGESVMVGTWEIPHQFPDLIEDYLARGGVDWPDIVGLQEFIAEALAAAMPTPQSRSILSPSEALSPSSSPVPAPTPGLILTGEHDLTWRGQFALDPVGNTISVLVLAGMPGVLVVAAIVFRRIPPVPLTAHRAWLIPGLCLLGFCVAGYLAYVETARVEAFCGPVGDCNTVQESEYARLFGILPIGILGMAGYLLIVLAWCLGRYGQGRTASLAALALFLMTTGGTLFSIYLTFLEPFVIGATCAWCLTSAVVMTLLFWSSLPLAKAAWTRLSPRVALTTDQKEL